MYTLLFFCEFIILFILSKILVQSLLSLFFNITKSKKATVILLSFLFFPGTVVHEFSHLLSAGLMLVRTGNLELTPQVTEGEIKLGSLEIEKTDIFRRSIIGIAPILVGLMVIFGTLLYFQSTMYKNLITDVVVFYVLFEVGNTLFSSRKDLEGVIEVFIVGIFMLIALVIVKPGIVNVISVFLQRKEVVIFFKTADEFLIVPLLSDLAIIFPVKVLVGKINKW